jgi:ankyrin repeat protein
LQGLTSLHIAAARGDMAVLGLLIDAGASTDLTCFSRTPLFLAAKEGNVDAVGVLLAVGASPNKCTDSGCGPLHIAASNGHVQIVDALVGWGAALNKPDNDGNTALMLATAARSFAVVQQLLAAQACPNAGFATTDDSFRSPLQLAVSTCQEDIVLALLTAGADANIVSAGATNGASLLTLSTSQKITDALICAGATVDLTTAVLLGDDVTVAQLLRERKIDVDAVRQFDSQGHNALHLAAMGNRVGMLHALLDAGANVHHRADDGSDALQCSILRGHLNATAALINAGASVNSIGVGGCTSLELACSVTGHHAADVVRLLLASAADVGAKSGDGPGLLAIAVLNSSADVVAELLAAGTTVDSVSPFHGGTPLFLAARDGHLETLGVLLDNGATVNASCHNGDTPLIVAAKNGHVDVVKTLLRFGASERAAKDGSTPLSAARAGGHRDIAHVLEQTAADGVKLLGAVKRGDDVEIARLLAVGASLRAADWWGATALHMAAKRGLTARAGKAGIVEAIVAEMRADLSARDGNGKTPVDVANSAGHAVAVDVLQRAARDRDQAAHHVSSEVRRREWLRRQDDAGHGSPHVDADGSAVNITGPESPESDGDLLSVPAGEIRHGQALLALTATVAAAAPFVESVFRREHASILARSAALGSIEAAAPTTFVPPDKKCAPRGHTPSANPGCVKCQARSTSATLDPFAAEFANLHTGGALKMVWSNSNARLWATPGCHIEMAKLFSRNMGDNAGKTRFDELDGTALFNMMTWCTAFHSDYNGPNGVGRAAVAARNVFKHIDHLSLTMLEYDKVFAGLRVLLSRLQQEADPLVADAAHDAITKLDAWQNDHRRHRHLQQHRAVAVSDRDDRGASGASGASGSGPVTRGVMDAWDDDFGAAV